jgi:hypothetical protein
MDNAAARKLIDTRSMTPEQVDSYRRQTEAFRAKFGREMGPDDPFFFDPELDYPQFRAADAADEAVDFLAHVMSEIGLDPSLIYAFKRTGGLFPTMPEITADELAEWNAALNEYYWSVRAGGVQ